jgi:hypothetical protein
LAKKAKSAAQPTMPAAADGEDSAFARLDHKSLLEHARFTNAYVTDYIKFADAKAGAITAGATAGMVLVQTLSTSVLEAPALGCVARVFAYIFAIGGGLALLLAAAFSLCSLIPRIKKSNGSLFSFPDICGQDAPSYLSGLCSLDGKTAFEHLSNQNHNLCNVVSSKFTNQKRAVVCLLVSLPLIGLLAILQIVT